MHIARASRARVLVATGAVAAIAVAQAPPAAAHLHFMMIRELFGGSGAAPSAQYVELQMYSSGQNSVHGAGIKFYNAAGTLQHTATFQADVGNGADNSTILIATTQAETLFGVQADLELTTAALASSGGKVCFEDPGLFGVVDCVSFGNYGGSQAGTGTPFNSPEGIPAGATMLRDVGAGLDPGDDTNNSAADFSFAAPSPRNNAGNQGSSPGGVLDFSVGGFSVDEGSSSATITVIRTGGTGTANDVDYATLDGTATAGEDYTAGADTLSFSGAESSKTFDVPITDDQATEGDETVRLRLRDATSGAMLGPRPNATLTINDDEAPVDDLAPVSRITRPTHGSGLRSRRLTSMRGTAQDDSPIERVQIALRMTRTNGSCRWLVGSRFVRGACGAKRWRLATGKNAWGFPLPNPLPRSKGTGVRHYTLFSRATDDPGNVETTFGAARNANRFEIR